MNLPRPLGALRRLATQVVAVLVLSSLVAWIGISAILLALSPQSILFLSPTATRHVVTLFNALHALEAVPAADRGKLLSAFQRPDFAANLADEAPHLPANDIETEKEFRAWFFSQLPPGVDIVGLHFEGRNGTIVAKLSDARIVVFRVVRDVPHFLSLPVILVTAFMLLSIVLLFVWAVRRLASPLSRFASAVDRFGGDGDEIVLREEGPEELRLAARAFNRMQQRISRLIEDRTRMLMAISHDLRTPLTRLRLRLDESSDRTHRTRMLDDIALMDKSIASAISFVREGGTTEVPELADLPSLLETVCSHFEDAGHPISFEGPQYLTVQCLPLALERGISNLVDNAVKYGTSVVVRLDATEAGLVSIDVEDDGPGLSNVEKTRVVEPFYRTEEARQAIGGFGLGLAIASTVARHHGGTLTLHDRVPHGLRVRMTIPSPLPQ